MGSFFPPVESAHPSLPSDAPVRLLRLLLVESLCLTESQVRDCVSQHLPSKERHLREARRVVRSFLDRLEGAGLLGKLKIPYVPPVTVSLEPILKDDQLFCALDEWPHEQLDQFSQASRSRVVPLERHTEERIYFATAKACDALRSPDLDETTFEGGLPDNQVERLQLLTKIFEMHPRRVGETPPSADEVSRSRLTALINLTQLLFADGFAEEYLSAGRTYRIMTQERNGWPYGRIARRAGPGPYIALVFLGSLLPHEVGKLLSDRNLAGGPSQLWLM